MLKDLDQSVNLLCDFYNLDLQLDEPIEAFLSGQLRSDLSPDPISQDCSRQELCPQAKSDTGRGLPVLYPTDHNCYNSCQLIGVIRVHSLT